MLSYFNSFALLQQPGILALMLIFYSSIEKSFIDACAVSVQAPSLIVNSELIIVNEAVVFGINWQLTIDRSPLTILIVVISS